MNVWIRRVQKRVNKSYMILKIWIKYLKKDVQALATDFNNDKDYLISLCNDIMKEIDREDLCK